LAGNSRSFVLRTASLIWLGLGVLTCAFPVSAQSQQPPASQQLPSSQQPSAAPGTGEPPNLPQQTMESGGVQEPNQQLSGRIVGTIVDPTGNVVVGAHVKLTWAGQSASAEVQSGDTGQFAFDNVAPGPFQITITAPSFATQTYSGNLSPGAVSIIPQITLAIATVTTQVRVGPSQTALAEQQLKVQEQQRVLAIIPNFFVTYIHGNAVPLDAKQKFELAWRSTIDPITIVVTAGIAGVEQAKNDYSQFGQGAQGYGKRFGTTYADLMTGTYFGAAIYPTLLKQDPRYFYNGQGTRKSRLLYALGSSVFCKGDNGRWQPNYSNFLGNITAGGLANFYYPSNHRGVGRTFERAGWGIGATAGVNVMQEFVLRHLTVNFRHRESSKH